MILLLFFPLVSKEAAVNRHAYRWALILILLVSLGCNLPAKLLATPTNEPTLSPPTVEEPLSPTETATSEPPPTEQVIEEPQGPLPGYPTGFFTTSGDGSTLTFYNLGGQPLGVVQTPGMITGPYNSVHVAGGFTGNPQDIPVVFQTFDNMGDIKQSLNGQVTTLVPGPDVANLRGAPGQNAYVYTTATWSGEALDSYFYARSSHGGGASWFWDRSDPNSTAMYPLAVEAENDELQTIFYTLQPWGIGGDIVFPPRAGLFQLNLEHLENILHLTEDFNPIGLSPDNTFVAYTQQNNVVNDPHTNVTIYNLVTTAGRPIDLASGSDRGAGYAVFSPNNQYVAWMEGSGWQMAEVPNFHSRVRIINTGDGNITADIQDAAFASAAADPTVSSVVPVGWLDGETLLVQAGGDNWGNPALVKVRFDGTGMAYVASGKFLGFLYP
jgi:hypothetical protein